MTARLRWRLAIPLIGLSALLVGPAVAGAIVRWPRYDLHERVLTVVICAVLAMTLGVSVSVGVKATEGRIPWQRMALIFAGFGLACGATYVRRLLGR